MLPGVLTQLADHTDSFITLQNAWTMQAVEDLSVDTPALYVYHGLRSGDPDIGETTCYRQRITKSVCLFIVCEPDDFEGLWNEVWTALTGYRPDPLSEPLRFLEGDTHKQTGQYLWWRDIYQLRRVHRKSE